MVKIVILAALLLATVASSGKGRIGTMLDVFSRHPAADWAEGATHGQWNVVFNGYGTQRTNEHGLLQEPMRSTRPDETHASLTVSQRAFGDVDLRVRAVTLDQLRTGSAPNDWERDWLLWAYTDTAHAYYLTCKTNGWELGKLDPVYPGGQRFLATGTGKRCAVGEWHTYRVQQTGPTISAHVDGTLVTTFTDRERPYLHGRIGLYNEDARACFATVDIADTAR